MQTMLCSVCVCVRECVCERVCVRARVHVPVRAHVQDSQQRMWGCLPSQPASLKQTCYNLDSQAHSQSSFC